MTRKADGIRRRWCKSSRPASGRALMGIPKRNWRCVMYYVEWCDHEGNLYVLEFENLEDATAECKYLLDVYGWCEIHKV